MPRRLDERMVVDAKGELIDIVNKKYQKWKPEDREFVQRDFVLRLEHFKELRRYSERKGTRLTEDDLKFDQDLLAKAVISGLFGSVEELAEKVARGEEETHRLGRTLETEKKAEKEKKELYGYKGSKVEGYDLDAARKRYIKDGFSETEAIHLVKADLLRLNNYEVCTVCGKTVDTKYGSVIIKEGVCYCTGCYEDNKDRGKPLMKSGTQVKCECCKKQILVGDGSLFLCPDGEDHTMSPNCFWYCKDCWYKIDKEWRRKKLAEQHTKKEE